MKKTKCYYIGALILIAAFCFLGLTACDFNQVSHINETAAETAAPTAADMEVKDDGWWKIFTMSDEELEEYAEKNEAFFSGGIKSYEELDDDMIRSGECGIRVLKDVENTTKNGYERSFFSFNGVDYYIEISAKEESTITISCKFDGEENNFRTVLLLPDDEVIDIPLDGTKNDIIIPEGITKVVLVGFQAKGTFTVSLDSDDEISIN